MLVVPVSDVQKNWAPVSDAFEASIFLAADKLGWSPGVEWSGKKEFG